MRPRQVQNLLALTTLIPFLGLPTQIEGRDFPHQAEVILIEKLTHNVLRFRLRPEEPDKFVWAPGQHVFVRVPHPYLENFKKRHGDKVKDVYKEAEEAAKPYSFASSPSNRAHFDLITKYYGPRPGQDVPPGLLSSYLHKHIRVGDVVTMSQPTGTLYEKNDSDRPIVVLAGGVGASPFVGLLRYWFENKINEKRKIYFFLGVRAKRDLLLHDQFLKWAREKKNFYYIPGLSRPDPKDDWKGETGYINQVFERYFAENIDADAYLAGSPIMVREAIKSLRKKGVDPDNIHRDRIKVLEKDKS